VLYQISNYFYRKVRQKVCTKIQTDNYKLKTVTDWWQKSRKYQDRQW